MTDLRGHASALQHDGKDRPAHNLSQYLSATERSGALDYDTGKLALTAIMLATRYM